MQVFQKEHSVLGGIDEAIAILKLCSGRDTAGGWLDGLDELEVHALHEGDEIEPYETVMTIKGDYALFAHLETVYLGTLARRIAGDAQRPRGGGGGERQADPLLPRAPRPLARADRRRLGGARGGRDRRVDRRPGVLVGRARRGHGAARADRRLRRRHRGRRRARSPTATRAR